jgi:hypothetical protein
MLAPTQSLGTEETIAMGSTADAIAFVHQVNKDPAIQEAINALRPRHWSGFFALAATLGYDLDLESFYFGCLSEEVVYFCPALVRFAGQLHSYKM